MSNGAARQLAQRGRSRVPVRRRHIISAANFSGDTVARARRRPGARPPMHHLVAGVDGLDRVVGGGRAAPGSRRQVGAARNSGQVRLVPDLEVLDPRQGLAGIAADRGSGRCSASATACANWRELGRVGVPDARRRRLVLRAGSAPGPSRGAVDSVSSGRHVVRGGAAHGGVEGGPVVLGVGGVGGLKSAAGVVGRDRRTRTRSAAPPSRRRRSARRSRRRPARRRRVPSNAGSWSPS